MLPEYFEFLNPVKMLCGSGALENIPYEHARLGVKKPLALVSRTLLEEGIMEMIGGKLEAVIQHNESDISTWLPLEYELQKTYAAGSVLGFPFLEKLQQQAVKDTERKIAEKGQKEEHQ